MLLINIVCCVSGAFYFFITEVSGFKTNDVTGELRNDELRNFGKVVRKLTLILPRSRTGTVWFYTSTSNKGAARPKLYTKSLTRDLKRMYSRFTLVRISIKL